MQEQTQEVFDKVVEGLTKSDRAVIDFYIAALLDDKTGQEQDVWEHNKTIEAENYSLKRQLVSKNKQIKGLKANYRALDDKYKKLVQNKKPKFRNKNCGGLK